MGAASWSHGLLDQIKPDLLVPNYSLFYLMYVSSLIAYFYYLVNVISLDLDQSDPIKRLLLYFYLLTNSLRYWPDLLRVSTVQKVLQ